MKSFFLWGFFFCFIVFFLIVRRIFILEIFLFLIFGVEEDCINKGLVWIGLFNLFKEFIGLVGFLMEGKNVILMGIMRGVIISIIIIVINV